MSVLGFLSSSPTDGVFFAIVPIHSRCFRQLCKKNLTFCLVAQLPKQSVNWNVGALLSRGFPLLDPPHKTRSGTLIGCGVMTGMVPGRLAPATDTAR
jgi:hypothetical protein